MVEEIKKEGKMKGKIEKKIFIRGKIESLTGLHIGGTSSSMEIGGTDKPVIRDSITNVPYIPGSSLKGKMRSLLEKLKNEFEPDGGPSEDPESLSGQLFGTASKDSDKKIASRVIVRDAYMDEESVKLLEAADTDLPYTEIKTEVSIDRITSEANPRQMERVPAGAKFDFELILNILEGDKEERLINGVFQAMSLLQDDYLGGFGSRGYGKVKFHIRTLTYKTKNEYENHEVEKPYGFNIPENLK